MSDFGKSPNSSDASTGSTSQRQNAPQSLRPLAPKPRPQPPPRVASGSLVIRTGTPLQLAATIPRRRSPAPCVVCYRVGCQLPTHTAFANMSVPLTTNSADGTGTYPVQRDSSFTASYAYQLAQQYVDPDIAASMVDPFYDLPLDPEINTPETHRLFHSWFAKESQKWFTIPRPREIVSDIVCGPFFMPAMQDPLLCLCVLSASAATYHDSTGQQPRNVTSLTLLGQAIQLTRERISMDPMLISDTTIVAVVFLWVAYIFLGDVATMSSNSGSVYAFVESRGGLHELGFDGSVAHFIRWVGTLHSFILPVPCQYLDALDPGPSPKTPRAFYGTYWDQPIGTSNIIIDTAVVRACRDTCRLIEQLEQADSEGITGAEYLRITQKLCVLYTNGSLLQSRTHNRGDVDECISLAIMLIQYNCFCGLTRLPAMSTAAVARLIVAIKATGGPSFWQQDLDLLMWLMVVVVMTPIELEQKSWCLPFLCRVIETRIGRNGKLKDNWKQTLKSCLHRFAWSNLRLDAHFKFTCTAIQNEVEADDDDDDE